MENSKLCSPRFGIYTTTFYGVFAVLGLIAYWGANWPVASNANSSHFAAHIRDQYETVVRGFDEQAVINSRANPTRLELGVEVRRYRLDEINPPKHFYVSLTDLAYGQKLERLYVSKHCNVWRQWSVGDEINLSLNKYTMSNNPAQIQYEFANLQQAFCQ